MAKNQDIAFLKQERQQCVLKIIALRQQRCQLNSLIDQGLNYQDIMSQIVDINKELNAARDRIEEIDKIIYGN